MFEETKGLPCLTTETSVVECYPHVSDGSG